MKKNNRPAVTVKAVKILVTGILLFALSFGSLIIPLRPSKSDIEKRELAKFPEFSLSALADGSYFSGISAWFSDTVPFRDSLVALNYKIQNILGISAVQAGFNEGVKGDDIPDAPVGPLTDETTSAQASNEPSGTSEPSSEAPSSEAPSSEAPSSEAPSSETPVTPNIQKLGGIMVCGNAGFEYYNFVQTAADDYARAVNRAASLLSGKARVYSLIIPTSIDITLDKRVRKDISVSDQKKAIDYMYGAMSPEVSRVGVFDTLVQHSNEYIFFRTDHHWTGLGAYYAYREFCAAKGIAPLELTAYTERVFDNFLGTFYADSGQSPELSATPDRVHTFAPPCQTKMTVTEASGNVVAAPVIYDATNSYSAYKYSSFIYGDNPFSVIENLDASAEDSCILIKDSFGNAFAPLIVPHYKYVYVLDFRYDNRTVYDLVTDLGISDVIFLNNISMTRDGGQVGKLRAKIG